MLDLSPMLSIKHALSHAHKNAGHVIIMLISFSLLYTRGFQLAARQTIFVAREAVRVGPLELDFCFLLWTELRKWSIHPHPPNKILDTGLLPSV
jgi:hypothetical protein